MLSSITSRSDTIFSILEVAPHFIKADPERQEKYERLAKRKNRNTAKVILARDLLRIIYCVLKEKRRYYANNFRPVAGVALSGV